MLPHQGATSALEADQDNKILGFKLILKWMRLGGLEDKEWVYFVHVQDRSCYSQKAGAAEDIFQIWYNNMVFPHALTSVWLDSSPVNREGL